jgi:hypothetical protein
MAILVDQVKGPAADRVADIDQKLHEQRHRVGFRLRSHDRDNLAGEAMVGGRFKLRPCFARGGLCFLRFLL